LAYFKHKDANPKGVISLYGAIVEKHNRRPFGILIRVASRDYLMCASDHKEQTDWIESIQGRVMVLKSLVLYKNCK